MYLTCEFTLTVCYGVVTVRQTKKKKMITRFCQPSPRTPDSWVQVGFVTVAEKLRYRYAAPNRKRETARDREITRFGHTTSLITCAKKTHVCQEDPASSAHLSGAVCTI